jgi:hypothetical protein
VTLSIGAKQKLLEPERWLAWDGTGSWQQELIEHLSDRTKSTGLKGIRDARVASAVEALRLVADTSQAMNAGQIRLAAENMSGEDLNRVFSVARELKTNVAWKGFGNDGLYEVIFNPQWTAQEGLPEASLEHYRRFANAPALSARGAALAGALNEHLLERVPQYMLPSAIVPVAAWPLTANGKIDKRALEALAAELELAEQIQEAPGTATEHWLAAAWAKVLGVPREQIGRRDHFFDSGGTSLSALKLAIALDRTLSFKDLIGHPTLAEQAELLDRRLKEVPAPVPDRNSPRIQQERTKESEPEQTRQTEKGMK